MIAAVVDVGIPSVSSGTSVAVTVALFAASGPATPSMAPVLPNSSGFLESFFSRPYERNVGISVPPAGMVPKGKPSSVPRTHAGHERRHSGLVIHSDDMR